MRASNCLKAILWIGAWWVLCVFSLIRLIVIGAYAKSNPELLLFAMIIVGLSIVLVASFFIGYIATGLFIEEQGSSA